MKLSVPYQKNDISILKEQAAGFAPYTRGYINYGFKPLVVTNDSDLIYDFQLKDADPKSISTVLETILKDSDLKSIYTVFLEISDIQKRIITTAVLRSLLSFISLSKKDTTNASEFHFYSKNTLTKAIIIDYQTAEIAQINTLITTNLGATLLSSTISNPTPIDPFYGSESLKTHIELLFNLVWNQIKAYFIL